MSELKCHYCGAECCEERRHAGGKSYMLCLGCGATGPECNTPEAAAAAHATVAPVPRWTSEPPKVPDWYCVLGSTGDVSDVQHLTPEAARGLIDWGCKIAGPVSMPTLPVKPAGAAEGGGA